MIYVTGDCHSRVERFGTDSFKTQKELTKDDYVIVCGDFGLVWNYKNESTYEKEWLDWLDSKNFTTLFVDGNHENFDRLYSYPVEEWNGGKVHKIRPSVIHLMRGEIYNINGKKIFAFGGASSHDIKDGILNMDEEEKIYEYRRKRLFFRIRGFSWWDLELPTNEEMTNGMKNLIANNFKVDYVISHCCPTDLQILIGGNDYKKDVLTDYFYEIKKKLHYKKWFFGHYHFSKQLNEKFTCLYYDIVPIDNEL